jgi:hypothetical protein
MLSCRFYLFLLASCRGAAMTVLLPGMSLNLRVNLNHWNGFLKLKEMNWPHGILSTVHVIFRQKPTLALSGNGKEHANGLWTKTMEIVPGGYYQLNAFFKAENTGQPWRSVLARIIWLDEVNMTDRLYRISLYTERPVSCRMEPNRKSLPGTCFSQKSKDRACLQVGC